MNDSVLKELERWLKTEREYYKSGAMTSIAESVWGERVIRDVQEKIRGLMVNPVKSTTASRS